MNPSPSSLASILDAPHSTDAPTASAAVPNAAPPAPAPSKGGRFARLPLLAGRSFIPLGLFARLPLAMLTVGALTLATAVTGSYAVGGAVAGAVGMGSALGAPVLGACADRLGQRPVLLFTAILNAVAVVALIIAAYLVPSGSAPGAIIPVLVIAFVAGVSCPQVGSLARVRWMALTSRGGPKADATDLDTALSYESTADELTFVLGPALVGILASLIAPWLPLALAAALTITLVPAFAVHPTHTMRWSGLRHAPRRRRPSRSSAAPPCRSRNASGLSPPLPFRCWRWPAWALSLAPRRRP